jgi:hypothetical protein
MSMRGHTVRENVIIAYRGVNYELGQWPHGYGIWAVSSEESLPTEWWDPTPDGWSAAWYRFTALEQPGSISQVGQPAAGQAGPASGPGATALPAVAEAGVAQPTVAPPTVTQPTVAAPTVAPSAAVQPPSAATPGQYAAQPHTGQPYAGQSYAGQPYAGQPYAGQAHAGQAHAGAPWAAGHSPGAGRPPASETAPEAPLSPLTARIAAGLLGLGVIIGVVGLFPTYLTGASLASDSSDLWLHLIYLAGWAVSAVLIFRGGRSQRAGALIATGASVVTFGFFLADAGYPISGGAKEMGAGLILSVIGWLACAIGSAVAFGRWPAGWPRRPTAAEAGVVFTLIAAAIGVAITFAPSWDKYTIPTATGVSLSETVGNAFSNPGAVIAGDVLVMIGLVAVVVAAAFWRPARTGWALVAGALIPVAAQVVSALVQISQVTTAGQLGLSPAEAAQLGISTSEHAQSSLTLSFWLYCLFALILFSACVWVALGREQVMAATPSYGYGSPAGFGSPNPPVLAGTWPAAPPGYGPAGPPGSQTGYGPAGPAGAQASYQNPPRGDAAEPPAS